MLYCCDALAMATTIWPGWGGRWFCLVTRFVDIVVFSPLVHLANTPWYKLFLFVFLVLLAGTVRGGLERNAEH
jgi:hypothetical protein